MQNESTSINKVLSGSPNIDGYYPTDVCLLAKRFAAESIIDREQANTVLATKSANFKMHFRSQNRTSDSPQSAF